MYRIKTDIRQYKCETREKVEKLIRNWVIRPNDLIYLTDAQEWSPIGDHPEFLKLFGILDAQEQAEPDTVITDSPREGGDPPTELGDAASEEVTNVKERPTKPEEEQSSDGDEDEIDDEELTVTSEEDASEAVEDQDQEDEPVDEIPDAVDEEDLRETDIIDEDDVADHIAREEAEEAEAAKAQEDQEAQEQLAPPEAPEGVEPTPAPDEVTMMTEKTLDLLTIDDESEAVDETNEEIGDDDVTLGAEPVSLPAEDEGEESVEEGEDSEAEAETLSDDEDVTDEADGSNDEEEELDENPDPLAAATDRGSLSVGKRGRHDLPEEFFATNEISQPVDRESIERLDELGELSEPVDEEPEEEDSWEDGEDLRTTTELNPDEIQKAVEEDKPEDVVEDEAHGYEEDDEYDEDEWDDEEDELDPAEVAAVLLHGKGDHVENPYAIPLPFAIEPTEADVRVGLKKSTQTRAAKDRSFPYPAAKTKDTVVMRSFDLTPKPAEDKTLVIMAAVLVGFVLLVIALVILT